jgi:hypothetical protein
VADLRISELPVLLGTDAEANDDLAIADYSSSETRRVTLKGAVQQGVSALIDDAVIPGAKLVANSVTATQIAADAITASELADGAVDTAAIVDDAVTNSKLASGIDGSKLITDSVTATQIAANAITASELADNAVDTGALVNEAVTNAKLASGIDGAKLIADSVTATQIAANAITASELANDAVDTAAIVDAAVTNAKIASGIDGAKLSDGSVSNAKLASGIDGAKLISNSVTQTQIATDAITASELADNSVDTAALINDAVTTEKIVNNAVTTEKIATDAVLTANISNEAVTNAKLASGIDGTKLVASSVTSTQIAANAITSTELADNAVDTVAIVDNAVTDIKLASGIDGAKLTDATVTNAKLVAGIEGSKLTDNSITNAKLAADSVTATQVAADAIGTTAIIDGSITNAKLATGIDGAKLTDDTVTDAKLASGINGSKISDGTITDAKLATGIGGAKLTDGSVAATKFGTVSDRGLDQTTGNIGHTNNVTAGTSNGITFDEQGHITGTTALVAADLPAATESTIGGVSIPVDSGLTVTALGVVDHANNVTGATVSGFTYDEHGHIVSAAALVAGDLPIATEDDIGGVAVPAGSALTVNAAGDLAHEDSAVVVGTYTKVTVDQKGHVTAGATLTAADIPSLDASKITTGTFSSGFLAPNSVTAEQLADYGIAQVSESQPIPEFAGQWWINPSDRSAYIWIGTVSPEPNGYWLLVGYGSPTQLNLRFGGTYNATANTVVSLNQYGVEAGLTVGQALSAPNTANNGVYLAVTTAGTGTTPAPTVSLAVGDWVLSQGTGANWTKVAVVSGASGTFNDYDILCDGTYFTPDMTAVADVRDALELIWGRVQIATGAQIGVVKESSEVVVDNSTGEMTIGVVDDGTY